MIFNPCISPSVADGFVPLLRTFSTLLSGSAGSVENLAGRADCWSPGNDGWISNYALQSGIILLKQRKHFENSVTQ